MKKKLLALLLALAMVAAMAACGSTSDSTDANADTDTGANTETETNTDTDTEADAGEGVTLLTDNTNQDQAKETELVNTYLAQKVDGLCIAPLNAEASVATLKGASESGLKIALTNIDLANSDFIVAGYTSDEYGNAYLAGEQAAKIILDEFGDKTVKIGVIQFQSLLPDQSTSRVQGYLDALTDGGVKYEVVADQDGLNTEEAMEKANGILTSQPDLDVFICACEVDTLGATAAVMNSGNENVRIFGYDGSDQISSYILDDNCPLMVSVSQDPYTMGYEAMTALIKACRGEDTGVEPGSTNYVDGIVLSRTDKAGVEAWRESQGFAN